MNPDPIEVRRLIGEAVMGKDGLGDRRGYRQNWDLIDDDIQQEIIEAVGRAACCALEAAGIRLVGPQAELIRRARHVLEHGGSDKAWQDLVIDLIAVLESAPTYGDKK